jgi:hypothetical protein
LCFFQTQLTQLQTLTHRDQLAANATPTTPTPTQTCPSANPRRYRRFSFLVLPYPPQKGGRVGWGRVARQGKRDKCS